MGRHGENIRKRQDGRWEARFIVGYDGNGKAKYRYIYGKTYLEAKEKKRAAAEAVNAGVFVIDRTREKVRFRQVAQEWLAQQKDHVKESTYAHYVNMMEKQILPSLGDWCIADLDSNQMEYFLRTKLTNGRLDRTGGLSSKTVADMRSILMQIFYYAQKKCYVHAAISLPPVSVQSSQISVLTKSEQKRLEKVLFEASEPVCLGILTALYAGLRIGEVCALQWRDFNFEEGTIHISKTIIRIRNFSSDEQTKTKVLIQKPKTQCSIRTIPLPYFLVDYFRGQRKAENIYLMTGTEKYLEPRSCLKKYKRILKQAGLGDYTFHMLRHTFATRCVENNFDMKCLSEIMGHSSVSITMQRYVHPSMDLKRQQMNRLIKM